MKEQITEKRIRLGIQRRNFLKRPIFISKGHNCSAFKSRDCNGKPRVGEYTIVFDKPLDSINDIEVVANIDSNYIHKCRAWVNFDGTGTVTINEN